MDRGEQTHEDEDKFFTISAGKKLPSDCVKSVSPGDIPFVDLNLT
jgi:hypothetical protein